MSRVPAQREPEMKAAEEEVDPQLGSALLAALAAMKAESQRELDAEAAAKRRTEDAA